MNEDWLTSEDDSASAKRAFLLHHGSADHIRKIVGATGDMPNRSWRMSAAMHNPHFPADMFETAFKIPNLRAQVAAHADAPDHIHQAALKFDNTHVRRAALMSDKTTYAQAEHAAKHDEDYHVQTAARERIQQDAIKQRPLREQSDEKPVFTGIKKSYIDFSSEIGTYKTHENVLKIDENVTLDEARSDNFFARVGTAEHITHALDLSHDVNDESTFSAATKNPHFSRVHQEMLMNHENPEARICATINSQTTTADLNKLTEDPDHDVAFQATRVREYRFNPRTAHKFDHEGKVKPEHASWHYDEGKSILEGTRQEHFIAKHGHHDHIDAAIDSGDYDRISRAAQNPAITRAQHEKLMAHPDGSTRFYALLSPRLRMADVHRMVHDPDEYVRYGALNRHAGLTPRGDHDGRVLEESLGDFVAKYGSVKDIDTIVDGSDDRAHSAVVENPLFTRAHHEKMMHNPVADCRIFATYSRHFTPADAKLMSKDPSPGIRNEAKSQYAFMTGARLEEDKKTYRDISIQAGIRAPAQDIAEDPELFSSYEQGGKLVFVPKHNIIATAKETNEGWAAMGGLSEDTAVHEWTPLSLTKHLQLSDGVHAHYEEAGVNSYPYKHTGGVDISRINAVHRFNYTSQGTNDFLHRNYHGLQRPWDAVHHENVALLDSVFHASTKAPLNVMSGLKQSPREIIDAARSVGHVGDHIHLHLPAYTSTTTKTATALAFTKTHANSDVHVLHIHVPVGHKAIGLETHPDLENGNESELILPRDTIVRVNTTPSVYRMGHRNVNVWMSHVVGSNSVPLKPLPNVQNLPQIQSHN